jgi:hypothetical protein
LPVHRLLLYNTLNAIPFLVLPFEEVEMSLTAVLPSVRALPRKDKFRLMQELLTELSQEEGLEAGEYAVWSPHDAHEAAATLLQLLEQDKKEREAA